MEENTNMLQKLSIGVLFVIVWAGIITTDPQSLKSLGIAFAGWTLLLVQTFNKE